MILNAYYQLEKEKHMRNSNSIFTNKALRIIPLGVWLICSLAGTILSLQFAGIFPHSHGIFLGMMFLGNLIMSALLIFVDGTNRQEDLASLLPKVGVGAGWVSSIAGIILLTTVSEYSQAESTALILVFVCTIIALIFVSFWEHEPEQQG